MNKDAYLIQRLSGSDLYNEFRQAFGAGTRLPLRLRPVVFGTWRTVASPTRIHSGP
jgi:hypothetical protein